MISFRNFYRYRSDISAGPDVAGTINEFIDAIDRMDAGAAPEAFKQLEDSAIAELFEYRRMKLIKPPKELAYVLKMLKKHLKTPLKTLQYVSSESGNTNLAMFSTSQDGMQLNLTAIKKMKYSKRTIKVNYHEHLESLMDKLEKWQAYQKKVSKPNDVKKARGSVNKLLVLIRNLEAKIKSGETPVPPLSQAYAKNNNQAYELLILHELGHRVRADYDKHRINAFFRAGDFPTEYSKRNESEYFSEIYCLTKAGLIDQTVISDEAKVYFKKAIK